MRLEVNALCGGGFLRRKQRVALGFGYIAGGYLTSSPAGLTERYAFSTKSLTTATSLSVARFRIAGAGNNVTAVFRGGTNAANAAVTTADEYTYATNTRAAGGALASARAWISAIGIDSFALFLSGRTGSSYITTAEKYEHATKVSTTVSGLETPRGEAASAGNASVGVVSGGYGGASILRKTEEVAFATLARTTRGDLAVARYQLAAASDATKAVFSGGAIDASSVSTVTEVYAFATGAVSPSTAATVGRYGHTALSDSLDATFFLGAINTAGANTSLRTVLSFTTLSWASLSSLGTPRRQVGSAASDSAGGIT